MNQTALWKYECIWVFPVYIHCKWFQCGIEVFDSKRFEWKKFCYWGSSDRCFLVQTNSLRNICCFGTYVIWPFNLCVVRQQNSIGTRSFPFWRAKCFGKSLFNINFISTQLVAHSLQIFCFHGRKKSFELHGVWILYTVNYPEQLSWGEGSKLYVIWAKGKFNSVNFWKHKKVFLRDNKYPLCCSVLGGDPIQSLPRG